ncbi:translation initiation factor eIF2B subunit beta-like isoform X2 [Gordionus sp. m RMFG-2023]|uniref:translation initiation factor eIF2B subunit beta-like isoform X2 n=1 Tax=Gordionus sp. m RMFG-2023 TaxID=3053472 RepID=UPI0031FD6554
MEDLKTQLNFDFSNPKSSLEKAGLTLAWIQKVVLKAKNYNVKFLIELIKKQKINAISLNSWDDPICSNILNRVKKILRDESTNRNDLLAVDMLHGLLLNSSDNMLSDYNSETEEIYKEKIFEALNELQIELENCQENISIQALEHIHSDETIMTLGRSETVENFLQQAAKTRKFHVIIAEGDPSLSGHLLAKNLSSSLDQNQLNANKNVGTGFLTSLSFSTAPTQTSSSFPSNSGLKVSVIPDSAIFAVMSRVNKVIVGANLTLANGGVQSLSGTFNMAASAKHYSVPFIVCAGMFKLTPTYLPPRNNNLTPSCDYFDICNDHMSSYENEGIKNQIKCHDIYNSEGVEFVTTQFDLVPPELITVFISNTGSYAPSYVYQLMRELYNKEDLTKA